MHSTENTPGKEAGEHKGLSLQSFGVSKAAAKESQRKAIGEVRKGNATSRLETSSCWCLFGLSTGRKETLFHGTAQ